MSAIINESFEQKLNELKKMVVLRQEECVALKDIIAPAARQQKRFAILAKVIVIILGALVATKGVTDLIMVRLSLSTREEMILLLIYTFLGLIISVIAALEAAFRFESKGSRLSTLVSLCQKYNRTFMSDYKKFIVPSEPQLTIQKLELLIESQNESLERIHDEANELGVDVSKVDTNYRI